MIYKNYQDLKLSALGMGTMRLPVIREEGNRIDEEAVFEMVDYAMAQGINYYDTAWGYHGGQSEIVMGKALGRYPRESYYLATKFPGYDLSNMGKVEEIFEKQLEKCGVDYFDFYLFHNVCELNIDAYLNRDYGIYEYLLKQKEKGRIRHLGFSLHGGPSVMDRFLEAYGEGMEFCQIQLNYLDWTFQDAKRKVEVLNAHNIPIWVMEPLRGGRLAVLSDEGAERLGKLRQKEQAPGWAFRFLQTVQGVTVVLSGMSNFEQLKENVRTFETEEPLNEEEMEAVLQEGARIQKKNSLPCTACRYCVDHCTQGLDIPELLRLYNEHRYTNGGFMAPMVLNTMPEDKRPGACIGCRSCEAVCPQQIKISEVMADFVKRL